MSESLNQSAERLQTEGYRAVRFKNVNFPDHLPLITDSARIASLSILAEEVKRQNVQGHTAELGVYRGFFAKLIATYFPDRKLYLFDTFEGFDKKQADLDKAHYNASGADYDFSKTSIDVVKRELSPFDNISIHKGFFPDSAHGIKESFCFVSLDVDLYEPTVAGLEFFYPLLAPGGYMIVHDYGHPSYPGCGVAVREFCQKNRVPLCPICDYSRSAVLMKL